MKETIVKYKKPIAAGVLILVLVLGYFYRDKWMGLFKKEEAASDGGSTSPSSGNSSGSSSGSSSTTIDKNKILKQGDRGEYVKELQRLLNEDAEKNHPTFFVLFVVEGVFCPKTELLL